MNLEEEITVAFNLEGITLLSDRHISENPCPLFNNPDIPQELLIPQYMLWVVKYGDADGNIVCENTLSDLAFLGRTQKPTITMFRQMCNKQQSEIISKFIKWCMRNLFLPDKTIIDRVQKYW